MSLAGLARNLLWLTLVCVACNSDVPVPASTTLPQGAVFTITRVATHPFLARYNLRLTVRGEAGCQAEAELFPDTGRVSRRNLYRVADTLYYVIGQYDARVVDLDRCRITLAEFHVLKTGATFLGSFDENEEREWVFLSASQRPEQLFEKR